MFASSIFPSDTADGFISGITSSISDNALFIIGVFAFVVGLSVCMALFDIRSERKWLDNYSKRWKK